MIATTGTYSQSSTCATFNTSTVTATWEPTSGDGTTVTTIVVHHSEPIDFIPIDPPDDNDQELPVESASIFAAAKTPEPGRNPERSTIPHQSRPSHRIRGPPANRRGGRQFFMLPSAALCVVAINLDACPKRLVSCT
jgi:hypothetical protein